MKTFSKEVLLSIFIVLQSGCYGAKDVTALPEYASHVGDIYRTDVNLAIVSIRSEDSKFCKYQALPAERIYRNYSLQAKLPSTFGGDRVFGVLPKGSSLEIVRFISEWSIEDTTTYPVVKILSDGPFSGWQVAAVLLENLEDVKRLDPRLASIVQPSSRTAKTSN